LISIIIPVFNAEKHLERCLSSVINQTYTIWACLLIDDGSTDGSSELCDEWEAKDERIKAIHQPNQGVSVARNKGIDKANGEWICFIDSDDWVEPNFLKTLLSEAKGTDIVLSGQVREYPDNKTVVYQPERTEVFSLDAEHANAFVELNRRFLLYAPHEKLYRADIIKNYSVSFPPGCQYGEDLIFNYQYLVHVRTISTIATAKYHYRMSSNTLSTAFRPHQFDEDYEQWLIVKKFFEKHQLLTYQAEAYLYQRLWGIVYDGIFLYPKLSQTGRGYLKKILNIPEISKLRNYKNVFSCACWIKAAILFKSHISFYCYFRYKALL